MKIGIIGAMEQEVSLLRGEMRHQKEWSEAGATFIEGTLNGKEVIVVQSGIGKVLAALTATLLISHYQVGMLINTGSAGGIGAGLQIGDLVIGARLAYFDANVTAFGYQMGQMAGMPLYYLASEELVAAVAKLAQADEQRVSTGLIVSGDTFVDNKQKIKEIKHHFPDVLANEMEGAAIAQVAHQYQVPFVVIRSVSDVADEEASIAFDEFIRVAGEKSANLVIALLAEL